MTIFKSCPKGHGKMSLKKRNKNITFRGVEVSFEKESYVCPVCGLGASNLEQAGVTQRSIANSYRETVGLLTGDEIREMRENIGLTQKALADKMGVDVASIKKWEGSVIQSKSADNALRDRLCQTREQQNPCERGVRLNQGRLNAAKVLEIC